MSVKWGEVSLWWTPSQSRADYMADKYTDSIPIYTLYTLQATSKGRYEPDKHTIYVVLQAHSVHISLKVKS